jgi:F-type H+-transporting ATPase subunit b
MGLFFFCSLAVAAGGGGEQGGAHDNGKLTDLLYRGINFTLLVIILVLVIKKAGLKDFFSARRSEIEQKFDDLKTEKYDAEKRYQELEKQLQDFEAKKADIIEQFRAEGRVEKEKIIADAQKRAEQIVAQAGMTVDRELQAAKERLKQEIVDAAAEKAKEIIAKDITDSDQDKLVDEFIEKVEKLH